MDKFDPESCIVSNFYIKSQLIANTLANLSGCIVSNFYIKSQQITVVHLQ